MTVFVDEATGDPVEECNNGCPVDSGGDGESSVATSAGGGYQIIVMAVFLCAFFVYSPN